MVLSNYESIDPYRIMRRLPLSKEATGRYRNYIATKYGVDRCQKPVSAAYYPLSGTESIDVVHSQRCWI